MSDILYKGPQFLALTDVAVKETKASANAPFTHYDVVLLCKGDIMFVEPLS